MCPSRVYIDIETRSPVDLKKTGVYPYMEHPDTELLCLAALVDDKPDPHVWVPDWVADSLQDVPFTAWTYVSTAELNELLQKGEIHAHNAQFERVGLSVLGPRYGIVPPPRESWRCSMALCGAHSLPLGLGKAAAALGLEDLKDDEGHKLMLKMSKPRRGGKA